MEYVAGYTVVHDVSARDWQLKKNSGQWLIGKTFDSFCPIGPAIVTKESISGNVIIVILTVFCVYYIYSIKWSKVSELFTPLHQYAYSPYCTPYIF